MKQYDHVERTAIKLVKKHGLINLSRASLCEAAGIPDGSFPHVMGCTFSELVERLKQIDTYAVTTKQPVTKSRANPNMRKDHILSVAIDIARKIGCDKITREEVAERAGVSVALVSRYFGTMVKLRRSVMRAAIKQEIPEIVARGLAIGDPHAKKAPETLKTLAINTLI